MDLIRGEREQKCFRPDCSKYVILTLIQLDLSTKSVHVQMMEKIIALKYPTEKEVRSTKKGLRIFTKKRGLDY